MLTDEYQDVCYAEYAWLRPLAARHGEIFAVGDDDQAVYSFRGAGIAHIRRFAGDFPRARQVCLEDNFRSTGHILAAANGVIARDPRSSRQDPPRDQADRRAHRGRGIARPAR